MRRTEDHFSRQAREQGFPARSVFKLQEIQERFRLIRPGTRILDLGAAPGSWSQYCLQKLGGRGLVVGVDLNEPAFRLPPGSAPYSFIRGSLFAAEVEKSLGELAPFDLVLSDAAPQTSGSAVVDSQRSLELAARAVELACRWLRAGGSVVVKVFQGGEEVALLQRLRAAFVRARAFKPGASRSGSREVYYLGFEKKAVG